jgi:hypothetical protein
MELAQRASMNALLQGSPFALTAAIPRDGVRQDGITAGRHDRQGSRGSNELAG